MKNELIKPVGLVKNANRREFEKREPYQLQSWPIVGRLYDEDGHDAHQWWMGGSELGSGDTGI